MLDLGPEQALARMDQLARCHLDLVAVSPFRCQTANIAPEAAQCHLGGDLEDVRIGNQRASQTDSYPPSPHRRNARPGGRPDR